MGKKCICEICSCGRHQCPHHPWRPGGDYGLCLVTSYNTAYRQHPLQPRTTCKPDQAVMRNDEPFSNKTTNRIDFVKHPLNKLYTHQIEEYCKPTGDIDTLTSYNRDYTEKHVPLAQIVKCDGKRLLPAKFEVEPTYRADYRRWPIQKHLAKIPDQWILPTQPFEGVSTFTHDYRRHNAPPRRSWKPPESIQFSSAPFDAGTGYSENYVRHPIQNHEQKERNHYVPPCMPFDGITTFGRDYTKKEIKKTESCKPAAEVFHSDDPIDDATTFKNDFRRWPGERISAHQQEQYTKPEVEMDCNTTYRLQYMPHSVQKEATLKTGEGKVITSGEFQGLTTYRNDYQLWETQRDLLRQRDEWVPNNTQFEGISTFKAHYIPHCVAPAKSMKPDTYDWMSNMPFEGTSMYRTDYVKKEPDNCPAAIIDTSQSKYVYVETDCHGHKQYVPAYKETGPLQHINPITCNIPTAVVT